MDPLSQQTHWLHTKLDVLISQALKLWPTKALSQLLEDPFAIVRQPVVEELQARGEQVTSPSRDDSITDLNPPRELDLTLDQDDLDAIGSDLWLLVFQA